VPQGRRLRAQAHHGRAAHGPTGAQREHDARAGARQRRADCVPAAGGNQILAANKIPPGLAEAKTNRAERNALQFEFWTQCIKPEVAVWLQPALNEQLFNPMGLRIAWSFSEIEAIQAAELEKAEAMAFAINGVALPAYQANLISVDEARSWIDAVGQAAALPPLDEEFTPEERIAPQPFGAPPQEGPGTQEPKQSTTEASTRPKAQPPGWGRHRVSLPS